MSYRSLTRSSEASCQPDPKATVIEETMASRMAIQTWELDLESWEPSSSDAAPSSDIQRQRKRFNLESEIPSWQDIEGLQEVSGAAAYRTTLKSPFVQAGERSRVMLEFKPIPDAHEWFVNGISVPGYDRLSGLLDISSQLQDGENGKTVV